MRLRIPGLLAMVAIFCVTEPAVASAQQPAKAWRIGLLDYAASDPAGAARWKAFREGLRELGYVEGQGVVFEARWGDGQAGRLRGLVTGVISLIGALAEKRLELFKQSIPRASRVAILRKPENRSSAVSLRHAESAAKSLGVVVQGFSVRGPRELDAAFLAMRRARIDGVILAVNTAFIAERRHIADLALKHRLVINLKTAKALGLTIPQSVLGRADEVIQ